MPEIKRATPVAKQRARAFRKALTTPEARLWVALRKRSADGLRFRRQAPFGPYILDFYDAEHRVAVEVDGVAHHDPEQAAHDERRDAYLQRNNVRVLRVPAWRVRDDLDLVVRWIVWKVRGG